MREIDEIRQNENKMTKRLVRLRDPETVADHTMDLRVWPYIPHEIHILVETCAIGRPALSCPIKGSRSWAGASEDWQAAVARLPASILEEKESIGSFVCEHMIEIGD